MNKSDVKKVVILESDLIENTPKLSFYKDRGFIADPDSMITQLSDLYGALPKLNKTKFYLVHQPSRRDDELSMEAREFWEYLLKSYGAEEVYVRAAL